MAHASNSRGQTRIQKEKSEAILAAALKVFANYGFRGATIDQIADEAGLSKPNLLYYFKNKEDMHHQLIERILVIWLDPLRQFSATGEPVEEICAYVQRKLEMARDFPLQSRLFCSEVLQGAPNIMSELTGPLKTLVDEKAMLIEHWAKAGYINPVDPYHLLFSIWATTQHYADFSIQVEAVLAQNKQHWFVDASAHLDKLFRTLLKPS
ncbi:TetR family transcriptional regulator C-terminal domain-containing protein [Polycladidibacter stylochi]|uniref:TetR family transcriptional regulator C-terminal domain-containing protein n=1 Tax=Polycladidibacter stylochi TaxID=1807766 RepID=UPI00082F303B|nr:TetR family transcriptional regulator C-terminal domain-containing protein [Pseudovibrio stylochi]